MRVVVQRVSEASLSIDGVECARIGRGLVVLAGLGLAVPNFTLFGDCRKGRRPGFSGAAPPEIAAGLFDRFCELLAGSVATQRGVFGAHMHVSLTNDGPVTLLLDSAREF